jgi:RHS repeat-associated protein
LHNDGVGLIYMNARYYVPSLGRFASADTIVPNEVDPQAWNRYSYVRNNPLIYNDPSGHCWGLASGMRDWNFLNYGTTCSNMDMAWNIVTHPNATWGERAGAGIYLAAEGLAHAGVVAGGTVAAVGCVVATSGICGGVGATAAGAGGTVAGGACADGDCTNEATMAVRGVSNVVQAISADGDPTNEINQMNRAYGVANSQIQYLRNTNLYNHFNLINNRLGIEEIKTMAFRLNIDHEMLATSGAPKWQYTYSLLRYLNESKSIQQLNNLLLEYPHLKDEIIQLMQ